MRRLILVLLLVAVPAWAGQTYTSAAAGKSVTDVNTAVTFTDNRNGGSGATFTATTVSVYSRAASANTCMVNFDQSLASATLDIPIAPGTAVVRTKTLQAGWTNIGMICTAGQTATFDIIAQGAQ
jgi:hypothetical protein